MKELPLLVETVLVNAECDCGGRMVPTGMCLTVHPPLWPHKCITCGKIENLDHTYPRVDYRKPE